MLRKLHIGLSAICTVASLSYVALSEYTKEIDVKSKGTRYHVSLSVVSDRHSMPSFKTEHKHLKLELMKAYDINEERADKFSEWILFSSIYSSVPYELLTGVIMTESSFRYNAKSSVGAIGPAQIRPKFWSDFCGTLKLSNPAENVECSGRILRLYYDKYCKSADWGCALGLYNVGPTNYKNSKHYQNASLRYRSKVANHASMITIPEEFMQNFDSFAVLGNNN